MTQTLEAVVHIASADKPDVYERRISHGKNNASRSVKCSNIRRVHGLDACAKSGKGGKLSSPAQGTVNINTASAEELQRIPGIGPAMAERILEFRQGSGKFTSPEDLLHINL